MGGPGDAGPDLQLDRAHGARIYDYILGGKDNFAPDRQAAENILRAFPAMAISMRANRAFLGRVARRLVTEHGVRQFLDIGTGIPTSPNLHEVVQADAPDARIVYVDNDPIVLAHASALMTGTPQGRTAYVHADLRDPDSILAAPAVRELLDFTEPIALVLVAVLQFVLDDAEAYAATAALVDALPSGSFVALSVTTDAFDTRVDRRDDVPEAYRSRGADLRVRTPEAIARFVEGLDVLEPGLVQVHKWHPDPVDVGTIADADVAMFGGLARKP